MKIFVTQTNRPHRIRADADFDQVSPPNPKRTVIGPRPKDSISGHGRAPINRSRFRTRKHWRRTNLSFYPPPLPAPVTGHPSSPFPSQHNGCDHFDNGKGRFAVCKASLSHSRDVPDSVAQSYKGQAAAFITCPPLPPTETELRSGRTRAVQNSSVAG